MTTILSSRLFARLITLFLLGFCIALWPLAGYAATIFVTESVEGVDGTDQAGLAVTKTPSVFQAGPGTTIVYTYRITNTGSVPLTSITANDNRLGPVTGLAGALTPGSSRTATLQYTVQASDPAGPLVNTVTVTGTVGAGGSVTSNSSATVLITGPTSLPETEQPNQPQQALFLPSILP